MDYIYAPWRSAYFTSKPDGCVFCNIVKNSDKDEENLVLFRDSLCFGVLNLYPYSPGHFMIIPYEHKSAIEELDAKIWTQMSLHVQSGVRLLKEVFKADGVNIGMNLGRDSGGGIKEHVHYHLVPRRRGDANFITSIANTRVNGIDFKKIYDSFKKHVPSYFEVEA